MGKKSKVSFRFLGKIGFLLVVIGFFMPVNLLKHTGFELAKTMSNINHTLSVILIYVLFAAAVAGVLVGVSLLLKKKVKVSADWICVAACIGSGLIVYFSELNNGFKMQTGACLILIGWIVALAAQLIAHVNKET